MRITDSEGKWLCIHAIPETQQVSGQLCNCHIRPCTTSGPSSASGSDRDRFPENCNVQVTPPPAGWELGPRIAQSANYVQVQCNFSQLGRKRFTVISGPNITTLACRKGKQCTPNQSPTLLMGGQIGKKGWGKSLRLPSRLSIRRIGAPAEIMTKLCHPSIHSVLFFISPLLVSKLLCISGF